MTADEALIVCRRLREIEEICGCPQPSDRVQLALEREVLRLRECIERCKSVQQVAEAEAIKLEQDAAADYDDRVARTLRQHADIRRRYANELAKALEGF